MKNFAKRGTFLLFLALPILAGCGESSSGITLTVWEDQSNIETLKALGDDFVRLYKKTYPGAPAVTIKWVEQAEASAVEKLVTVASTGNGPDVLAVTHDTIITAANAGVIAPASFQADIEKIMSKDALLACSTISSNGNATLYGYPITAESQTVIYDKTKVTPTELASFDSLKSANKKIAMNATDDGSGYYMFGLLNDAVLFGEDGTSVNSINLQTNQSVANIVSFYNDYSSSVLSLKPEDALSSLVAGDVVGLATSPFIYSSVVSALGQDRVGIAKLPMINGQDERPFSGYKAYCVNSYSPNPSIAQELARFLTSPDSQWTRLDEKHYYPALDQSSFTADISATIASSEADQVFGSALSASKRMPSIARMANYWSPAQSMFTSFWNDHRGTMTADIAKAGLAAVEAKLQTA